MVFVGNGRYGEGLIDLADRESLDSNELDVRVAVAEKPLARLRLLLALLFGRLARSELLERMTTSEVTIDIEGRGTVEVALDGEVERLETPLRYRSLKGELSVLVPGGANTVER
jgi:undecaprenyl-diphosphatase